MPNAISPKVVKKLLALKKKTRAFLVMFKKLKKGTPEYRRNAIKYTAIKNLFSELSLMDLTIVAPAPVVASPAIKTNTSKDERKARRETRKDKRKDSKVEDLLARMEEKAERKKQKKDKNRTKEEAVYRYDTLVLHWKSFDIDNITGEIHRFLNIGEKFIIEANNFISFAEAFTTGYYKKEIKEVRGWIEKAQKFVVTARKYTKQVEQYVKIFGDVVSIVSEIPTTVEAVKGEIVTEATRIFAEAKQFLATVDLKLDLDIDALKTVLNRGESKLDTLSNIVGVLIEDKDKNNLPDWFDKLQAQYKEVLLNHPDIIPGIDLDDKVLLQIKDLNVKLKDFVATATKQLADLGIPEKIEEIKAFIEKAKQWKKKSGEFLTAITGFVDDLKAGDLTEIYKDLKDFKLYIETQKDPLKGTKVDNVFLEALAKNSKKAETWLMNAVSGGDPAKEKEIKELLSSIDDLILSGGGIVDHSSKYAKDLNSIEIPEIVGLSDDQKAKLMKEHGFNPAKEYSSLERILGDISLGAIKKKKTVTSKYKVFLKIGSKASQEFSDAREQYLQAVKAHNNHVKAVNAIGVKVLKGIVGGVASLVAPGTGSIISALGDAVLGDMFALNAKIKDVIPPEFSFIADLAEGVVAEAMPRFGTEEGIINAEGEAVMKGMAELYSNGITAKYTKVYELLITIEGQSDVLRKNLIALDQASKIDESKLKDVNNSILILAQKWKKLNEKVQAKYLDLENPSVNTKAAFFNASRYFHSAWLVRYPAKKIDIANTMIKEWKKFHIMQESGAEWSTGGLASLGRSFFGFFGVDPFDYVAELNKLKTWAFQEQNILKTQAAWVRLK